MKSPYLARRVFVPEIGILRGVASSRNMNKFVLAQNTRENEK
jgi:hypothetical protein